QEMLDLVEGRKPKILSIKLCKFMEDISSDSRYSIPYRFYHLVSIIGDRFDSNRWNTITIQMALIMYWDMPSLMRDALKFFFESKKTDDCDFRHITRSIELLHKADIDWLIAEGLETEEMISHVKSIRKDDGEDYSTVERREGLKRREEKEEERKRRNEKITEEWSKLRKVREEKEKRENERKRMIVEIEEEIERKRIKREEKRGRRRSID
ncbi:hypothetical protein PFISCL1PPCAC_7989, partial [Pristionchus fissidentatus]